MKEIATFSFFVPNQPEGKAKNRLSQFLQKLVAAKIKLRSVSATADRRRFKIYCAREDPAKLRAFLKSAMIRTRERVAFVFEFKDVRSCLTAFNKFAISAFDFKFFNETVIGKRATGLIWS